MKNLFVILFAILSLNSIANAADVIISERDVVLNVDIKPGNVKLSRADYSEPVVKVLVPELADVTVLDHRNNGEGAPCLATYETNIPDNVIQNQPATEKVKFKIVLTKQVNMDHEKLICHVTMNEQVTGSIRGFTFTHLRTIYVGERHANDCR